MSDTVWSFSGTIGIPDFEGSGFDEPQRILQGLGMPLRPIRGVPPVGSGDIINIETVATGNTMIFTGGWQEGKIYLIGYVVVDGLWVMIANTNTVENPLPQSIGPPTFGSPSFTPSTQSDFSTVFSGQRYEFTDDVVLRQVRVWAPTIGGDVTYRLQAAYTFTGSIAPATVTIDNPALTAGQWSVVTLPNQLVPAGTVLVLYLEALNSGSNTAVIGDWIFEGVVTLGAPPAQSWNHDPARTLLRINKTDLDSDDRGANLLGMILGTSIQFVETATPDDFITFRTTGAPVDEGTYVSYEVVVIDEGTMAPAPQIQTTMNALVPVAQSTEYSEEIGVPTPSWATVTGFLAFDDVLNPAGNTNSYGVDIECEPATFSDHWDVVSYNAP